MLDGVRRNIFRSISACNDFRVVDIASLGALFDDIFLFDFIIFASPY